MLGISVASQIGRKAITNKWRGFAHSFHHSISPQRDLFHCRNRHHCVAGDNSWLHFRLPSPPGFPILSQSLKLYTCHSAQCWTHLLDILFQHLAQFRLLGGKWKWGPILAGNPTHGLLLVSILGERLCLRESESAIVMCLVAFSGQLHWSVQGINIFSRDLALGLTFGESLTKQSSKPYICLFRTVRNTQVWNKSFPFCSSGS